MHNNVPRKERYTEQQKVKRKIVLIHKGMKRVPNSKKGTSELQKDKTTAWYPCLYVFFRQVNFLQLQLF